MPDSKPFFSRIYSSLPEISKLIIEDILVIASFYFVLTSFNLCVVTALGVSLSILLMKYLYKLAIYYLPFNGKVTARSVHFTSFSLVFLFLLMLLNFLDTEPDFIAYCLVFLFVFWTFAEFYKQNKPENLAVANSLFFLMKLGKIAIKIGICLVFIFIGNKFFISMHLVPTSSMAPTVHTNEVILSDKMYYKSHNPQRWDTAVLEHQGYNYKLLKRVVGLPGEEISIAQGNVYKDGEVLVRPQNVIYSQMQKAPITLIDFEKRFYNNEDKNKKVNIQFNSAMTSQKDQQLKSALMTQLGPQTQPQTKPAGVDEIFNEFANRWQFTCGNQETREDFARFYSTKYRNEDVVMFVNNVPIQTDVNGAKQLTDDVMLQLDSRLSNAKEMYINFQVESMTYVLAYAFIINMERQDITFFLYHFDKMRNAYLRQNEKTLKLDNPLKLRSKIRFQVIDGMPVAFINDVEYKTEIVPVCLTEKIESFQVGIALNAQVVDIFSIGLFTPAYYYPHGILGEGKTVKIPDDSCIVLGDNSSYSLDSRDFEALEVTYTDGTSEILPIESDYQKDLESQRKVQYPFVKLENIISRAFAVYKPIELARLIK